MTYSNPDSLLGYTAECQRKHAEEHIADNAEFHDVKIKTFINKCLEDFVRCKLVEIRSDYVYIQFGTVVTEKGLPKYEPRSITISGKYFDKAVKKIKEIQTAMKVESESLSRMWSSCVSDTCLNALLKHMKKEEVK